MASASPALGSPNSRSSRSKGWYYFFLLSIAVLGSWSAYAAAIPLMLLGRLFPPLESLGGRALQVGVRSLFYVQPWLDLEVDFKSLERTKAQGVPCITVSNHRSHLDMFILLANLPNLQVAAKSSLFFILPLTPLLLLLRVRPIRKGNAKDYQRAFAELTQSALQRKNVNLFPEMTRCERGHQGTLPFHLSPFHELRKSGLAIVPIVFHDTDLAWPKGDAAIYTGHKLRAESLEPIKPLDFPSADALRAAVRQAIDTRLAELGV